MVSVCEVVVMIAVSWGTPHGGLELQAPDLPGRVQGLFRAVWEGRPFRGSVGGVGVVVAVDGQVGGLGGHCGRWGRMWRVGEVVDWM